MGRQRVRAVGQFAWVNADLGVECGRCGLVTVYCDFEALDRFKERGWPLAVEEAGKRFRCRCGSADIRLVAIPIFKRPKPVPLRPQALRPIYREERRSLLYRGATALPDPQAIDAALGALRSAIAIRSAGGLPPSVASPLAALRPHVYRVEEIEAFAEAIGRAPDPLLKTGAARHAFNGILRQLGRPTE